MELYKEQLTLPGALPGRNNPQPAFRNLEWDMNVGQDGTFTEDQLEGYGKACGARSLPYQMQDRYIRSDEPVTLNTVVLENQHLKAVFAPELGGRLLSLFSKDEQRELLFRNPVLRIANLAIRGAWFSGGIEWNLGHTGHQVFTCDSVYTSFLTAPDGERFLRMYQYEAECRQVFQLDFHLPDGAKQLVLHARLENTLSEQHPLYWWTNTAVPQTEGTRVFSSTEDIVYQTADLKQSFRPDFGLCKMPYQPNLPDVDMSYPARIPRSLEYFFQNSRELTAPWEVSVEPDGLGFFERSTQPLRTRKLFCWGKKQGGRHWCEYLSKPGDGSYVEIQAGLAPTQLHTIPFAGGASVEFTQAFGAFSAQPQQVAGDWQEAQKQVSGRVDALLAEEQLQKWDREYAQKALLEDGELVWQGDRRAGLERLRRKKEGLPDFAAHLRFALPQKGDELEPWARLLEGEMLPESRLPLPYMTDPAWLPLLRQQAQRPDASEQCRFQLAVSLVENGEEQTARTLLKELAEKGNPWAAHSLGLLEKRQGNLEAAAEWLLKACQLEKGELDVSFSQAGLEILGLTGQYEAAWKFWCELPQSLRTDKSRLDAAEAAVKTGHLDFAASCFEEEFSSIREGASGLSNVWFEYLARRDCEKKGIAFTPDKIDDSLPMPFVMDFRMY